MKSVLIDLYLKSLNLNPSDITSYLQENEAKFQQLLEELNQTEELLYPNLDCEKKRIYDEAVYHRVDLDEIKTSHFFTEGFTLAMMIVLEIAITMTQSD